jgi:beta-1,4-mannosyltransferase
VRQQHSVSMAHVIVLVLGDIGRSPRMQYHALSLVKMGTVSRVTIIGYEGERALLQLRESPKVHIQYLQQLSFVQYFKNISVLFAIIKGLGLLVSLCKILLFASSFQLLIIQNPPCLPALLAGVVISCLRKFEIIIDWHNLGFSMYSHSLGDRHMLTKLTKSLEQYFCRFAKRHICVSNAMSEWLKENFNIKALVFYDKPQHFCCGQELSENARHLLLLRIGLLESHYAPNHLCDERETIQTLWYEGKAKLKCGHGRVALLVSSTSWTADEDFSMLLRALVYIESILSNISDAKECRHNSAFDRLLVVITGKGELKASFEEQVSQLVAEKKLHRFVFTRTAWLDILDYPVLLQCADLGISLHASTSGLDLPMKVVDMQGARLPVCALNFPTLPELVTDQYNGMIFSSDQELSDHILKSIFNITVENGQVQHVDLASCTLLEALRSNLQDCEGWSTHWNRVMRPMVEDIVQRLDFDDP